MAALCKPQLNKFFQPWVLQLNFLPLTPPLRKPPNRYGQVKKNDTADRQERLQRRTLIALNIYFVKLKNKVETRNNINKRGVF